MHKLHFSLTFVIFAVEGAKLRSWTMARPDNTLPPPRRLHGFTACDDGKLYVLGGIGSGLEASV